GADGTVVLVQMRAAGKAAAGDEGMELREVAVKFLRDDTPKVKLADARRVDDPAAEFEFDEFGSRRGVPPLLVHLADFADLQPQSRLDCIQQRGLADTTLPSDYSLAVMQFVAESVEALSGVN